jgi:hypothetical protein
LIRLKEQPQGELEQVFYLEPNDDLPMIREMLSWSGAPRVVLVVPAGCRALKSKVGLRLLHRYGVNLGKDVSLVTGDRLTRELAYEVGLPTFFSVDSAMRSEWGDSQVSPEIPVVEGRLEKPPRRRKSAWQMKMDSPHFVPKLIASSLFIMMLCVLAGGVFLVLPGATVSMAPETEPIEQMIEVRADPNLEQIDYETKVVPARLLGIEVEGSTEIPTSAKRDSPDSRARGKVVFINQLNQPVDVPVGTLVSTSAGNPIRFTTVEQVTVPGEIGATVEASVIATDPGPGGNVPPFLINTVEGPLAAQVKVINDLGMIGGGVRQVGVVTQADKDQSRSILMQQLRQEAIAKLQSELGEQEFVYPESVMIFPLDETYDRFVGEQADVLGLKMRMAARGTVIGGHNANALILDQLEKNIDQNYRLLPQGLTFQPGEVVSVGEDGSVVFKMRVLGNVGYRVSKPELIEAIQGKPVGSALDYLTRNYRLREAPTITVMPDWLGRVPFFPFRVQVKIET